ncbi:MAG: hypothetical protein ABSD76_02755 [Terriglobales bacterium]
MPRHIQYVEQGRGVPVGSQPVLERLSLMSIQEVSAEQLAELFHHYHQALGPDFGCKTKSTPESWDQVSQQERNRMVAAARLAILEVAATTTEPEDRRHYFAKPGNAEWGC